MKTVINLFLISSLIATGLAVRCFNCSLSEQSRCAKSVNLPMHNCPIPKMGINMTEDERKSANIKAVCMKTTKPSRDVNATHPYTRRFCGIFDGKKDNCDELIADEFRETGSNLSCYSCEKELCNHSSYVTCRFWVAIVSVIGGAILLGY